MNIEILFINSPTEIYPISGRNSVYDCMPPYGLLYCASICIKMLGKEKVFVLDAEYEGLSPYQIIRKIHEYSPRYIAINATTVNFTVVIDIISKVVNNYSVIIGGTHAIISPESFFLEPIIKKILFVCNGAGEAVFFQLFSGTDIKDISNIVYYADDEIIHNNSNFYFPIDEIIVLRDILPYDPQKWPNTNTVESYMLTSRGCPYQCSFCAANIICKNKILFRSPNSISKELSYLKNIGVNYVRFIDDLFMASPYRLNTILDCINKNGWDSTNFAFEATGRIDTLASMDKSLWKRMYLSGCKELEIGIESGSSRILLLMNKNYDYKDLYYVIDMALSYKIKIKAYIIVGYYTETFEDLGKTIDLCIKLKKIAGNNIRFSAAPAKAYPGTLLYQDIMNLSYMKNISADWIYNYKNVDLTDTLDINDYTIISLLRRRTRYNAMHVLNNNITALSELSGDATTTDVYKALCDITLISNNHSPLFFAPP